MISLANHLRQLSGSSFLIVEATKNTCKDNLKTVNELIQKHGFTAEMIESFYTSG